MTDSPKFDIEERRKKLWTIAPMFTEGTPHGVALGLKFVAVDIGRATISLPYNAKLIGDAETRVMFGGAVTALLDQACGLAALSALDKLDALATLDLRIDYMRAATPGETIIAEAHCYKATRDIAFVRAIAHDGDSEDPVASAQAIFMQIKSGSNDYEADRIKASENIAAAGGGMARE
ncbi:PaaI family thioesterase [Robiginitomaculum antarcticum]|uniref:PaaI family thioesterase n=1 Tax=Robiginitomaculum antarcticum TaxID=437507 RepID=UPI0003779417|nr:PaaI family thioesterase [Robiginitomaculum antarcticum]